MPVNAFKILFFSQDAGQLELLRKTCAEIAVSTEVIQEPAQLASLKHVLENGATVNQVLVVTEPARVLLSSQLKQIEKQSNTGHVVFGASASYHFRNEHLRYFYWKHYPRIHKQYNFLDGTAFMGSVADVKALLNNCEAFYPRAEQYPLVDLFHRYYVDSALGCFDKHAVKIQLDHTHTVIASVHASARKKLNSGWQYDFLYGLNENKIYEAAGRKDALQYPLNIETTGAQFVHRVLKTRPLVLSLDHPLPAVPQKVPVRLSFQTCMSTAFQVCKVNRINKGHSEPKKIFRYAPNGSRELTTATERIVSRLEKKLPLSFAHYNDGELSFIRDFLANRHHEKWFGRQQQQYNPLLAERLLAAMKFQKEGYFVGVPCSTDHPALSALAHELVGAYAFKVPAMAIHHNLSYLPRILHALKNRNLFFFINEYQDLSFFRHFGLTVHESRVFTVPFKNSYLEFDRYSALQFPDDAVVIMTCGMLAKILVHPWYKNHGQLTILALGSSLDDHIQKGNSNFELYPREFPLTKNIHQSRAFLFGYKKRCRECFDY